MYAGADERDPATPETPPCYRLCRSGHLRQRHRRETDRWTRRRTASEAPIRRSVPDRASRAAPCSPAIPSPRPRRRGLLRTARPQAGGQGHRARRGWRGARVRRARIGAVSACGGAAGAHLRQADGRPVTLIACDSTSDRRRREYDSSLVVYPDWALWAPPGGADPDPWIAAERQR